MAICRYWQQGSCSFGASCRFEHVGASGRSAGNVFAGTGNTATSSASNENIINTLVTIVKQDVDQSTKGKQWLFSCYSPAKDCVSIPGIEDISPEEMRNEAYVAKTAGTSSQYQQKVQGLLQSYQNKRQALLNPSQDLKEILRKIYSKEPLNNIPPNLFENNTNQGEHVPYTRFIFELVKAK